MSPAPRISHPAGLAVVVALVMLALFTVDRFLAGLEQQEIRSEAQQRYETGLELLAAGKNAEAVDSLQRAQALVRRNNQYALTFADALIRAGRTAEAEIKLREVLSHSSDDGWANLLMARLTAARNDPTAADSFYHRAVYGAWAQNAPRNRLNARLELAEYLARRGAQQQLLPEVLILQSRADENPALRPRVAELFMAAGSPTRASQVYRQVAQENPLDASAYKGAGEADLAAGDYRSAQNAFLSALRRDPGDTSIAARLRFVSSLAQLDPTPRRLRSAEKYRRSIRLLLMIKETIEQCSTGPDSPAAPLLEAADKAIGERPRGAITNEITEERLDLAQRLWQVRLEVCPPPSTSTDAAAIIMERLNQ